MNLLLFCVVDPAPGPGSLILLPAAWIPGRGNRTNFGRIRKISLSDGVIKDIIKGSLLSASRKGKIPGIFYNFFFIFYPLQAQLKEDHVDWELFVCS